MNILLIGGSGFVGTHLIQYLIENKISENIINIDKNSPDSHKSLVPTIIHDIRKPIPELCVNGSWDCIINLAAVHKTPGHLAHEYFETNILGASNICKLAELKNIKNIVFTSSISVYGPGEDEKSEDSVLMPNIPYGSSKAIAEYIHREWMLKDPSRTLKIIRPAVIFGKGENGNFTRIANALRKNAFVYPGRQNTIKSWVYIKDVVRLIRYLAEREDSYLLFNCCFPRKTTTKDICKAFHYTLGYKMPNLTIPLSILKLSSSILRKFETKFIRNLGIDYERILKLVRSTNISSEHLVNSGFIFEYNLEAAIKDWATECSGNELK